MQEFLERIWEGLKRFFQVDRGVKIGALFLAVILWVYVVASNEYVYRLEVPLRIVNIKPGNTLAESVPGTVTARFRGTGVTYFKAILTMPYSGMSLRVDARKIETAKQIALQQYVDEHPDNFIMPRGLNIELVEVVRPEILQISLDKRIEKWAPIQSRITVQPSPGYTQIGPVTIEPDSLRIFGPQGKIADIDTVMTQVLNFTNRNSDVRGEARLIIPNQELVQVASHTVDYRVNIQPISERRITDIPVQVRNVPRRLEATTAPSSVSMTIEGGSDYIYSLKTTDIEVYFDYRQAWQPGENTYEVQVETPEFVLRWKNLTPPRVEVVIIRK